VAIPSGRFSSFPGLGIQTLRVGLLLPSFNAESDHCHLLVELYPDVAPSRLVNTLKTVSSRLIRRDYQAHLSKFYHKPVFWTGAYCIISTGGPPLEIIKKYIESQDAPT
jgi:putative transposase